MEKSHGIDNLSMFLLLFPLSHLHGRLRLSHMDIPLFTAILASSRVCLPV